MGTWKGTFLKFAHKSTEMHLFSPKFIFCAAACRFKTNWRTQNWLCTGVPRHTKTSNFVVKCKFIMFLKNPYIKIVERKPVVDYPTFLWSDYPTDYPISDTRPPVVLPSVSLNYKYTSFLGYYWSNFKVLINFLITVSLLIEGPPFFKIAAAIIDHAANTAFLFINFLIQYFFCRGSHIEKRTV